MRKSVIALVAGLLLLVGCASTIAGTAATDPKAVSVPTSGSRLLTSPTDSPSSPSRSSSSSSRSSTTSSTTATSTSSTTSTTTSASPSSDMPAGFSFWSFDLAYRYMDTAEYDCTEAQVSGCAGVELFSAAGCPAGITVTMDIFDDADTNLGTIGGKSDPVAAGTSVKLVIGGDTTSAAATSASIKDLTC